MIVKEVAQRANLTVRQINRQIVIGRLKATFNLISKQNEITEQDYQSWQQSRLKPGRPKQEQA